eukprot:TRINITY_DN4449_c0_g1_i1.p1 TRINITY_DN4449_c0_g1~~TRINITY_DN4449_c0_g1_i1.p1  ORF type:complete len:656 (-),score=185.42 TRINITY_DN4449_c0_g1_i1:56-2023(-)
MNISLMITKQDDYKTSKYKDKRKKDEFADLRIGYKNLGFLIKDSKIYFDLLEKHKEWSKNEEEVKKEIKIYLSLLENGLDHIINELDQKLTIIMLTHSQNTEAFSKMKLINDSKMMMKTPSKEPPSQKSTKLLNAIKSATKEEKEGGEERISFIYDCIQDSFYYHDLLLLFLRQHNLDFDTDVRKIILMDYVRYLKVMNKEKQKGVLPLISIDFMWRTHMCSNKVYSKFCENLKNISRERFTREERGNEEKIEKANLLFKKEYLFQMNHSFHLSYSSFQLPDQKGLRSLLIREILTNLPAKDILSFSLVSKEWKELCRDNHLWNHFLKRDFSQEINLKEKSNMYPFIEYWNSHDLIVQNLASSEYSKEQEEKERRNNLSSNYTTDNKTALLGSGATGKSALVISFISDIFVAEYDPTIEESYRKQMVVDWNSFILEITDTAGQQEYSALLDVYLKANSCFIICYSIISRETFEQVREYVRKIEKVKEDFNRKFMCLVATKTDLENQREVSTKEGEELAREFGCGFFETSSLSKINVASPFYYIANQIVNNKREGRGGRGGRGGGLKRCGILPSLRQSFIEKESGCCHDSVSSVAEEVFSKDTLVNLLYYFDKEKVEKLKKEICSQISLDCMENEKTDLEIRSLVLSHLSLFIFVK